DRHSLHTIVSYTWSHTLDVSTDSNGGGAPMNPYWWKADYGNSNWDYPHRMAAGFVYDVPGFSRSKTIVRTALGNWQVNGVITLQSGQPYSVTTSVDPANTAASGTYRPNLVHTPTAECGRGHLIGCIDATAFTIANLYPAAPANFAYGDVGRNILRGPASQTVVASVFKNFPIKERLKFQFRFETFGLFNHTNFGTPSATVNPASFGNITSASGSRIIQLGVKLLF